MSYFYWNFDIKTVSAIKYLRFTKRYKDDRKILKEKKKKERRKTGFCNLLKMVIDPLCMQIQSAKKPSGCDRETANKVQTTFVLPSPFHTHTHTLSHTHTHTHKHSV